MDIARNKKAFFDYEILKKYEAGIKLNGNEIKSIRANNVNLKDAFVKINYQGELMLYNMHISEYPQAHKISVTEPRRARKLLMHRKEIDKLGDEVKGTGLTFAVLKLYFKKNKVKVQIGLARGKKNHDKRNSLKEKAINMDIKRQLKYR